MELLDKKRFLSNKINKPLLAGTSLQRCAGEIQIQTPPLMVATNQMPDRILRRE